MSSTSAPRRIDRNRRSKIVSATIDLMKKDGVNAVTHRRAAAAAGVPLGATTYYFGSIGELLAAALEEIVREDLVSLEERLNSVVSNEDMAELLAEFVGSSLTTRKRPSKLATEFMSVALRHDEVRGVARTWIIGWRDLLAAHIGERAALATMSAMSGLIQQAQVFEKTPSKRKLTAIMLGIIEGTAES